MLKTDPQNLWELYQSAVSKRERALASLDHSIERLCGPAYMSDEYEGEIESPEFELIAQTQPRIVWDNPRVRVSTLRQGPIQMVARAMHHGLNRLIVDTRLRQAAERISIDTLLRYGIGLVEVEDNDYGAKVEGVPGEGIPHRPKLKRISPRRYFQDPLATMPEEIRFRGHDCIADIEDLKARAKENPDEGWDTQLMDDIGDDVSIDKVYRPDSNAHENPKRGEIAYVEMYVDGYQIEDDPNTADQGYNGAIFTLAISHISPGGKPEAEFLREPRMAYCPPGGPYKLFGEYMVPDEMIPLAGIVSAMPVLEERARHQEALKVSAARRKQIGIADGLDPTTSLEIKDAKDGDFLIAPGFETAKAMQLELGGVTELGMAYKQYLDIKADRILAASDAGRGNVTGTGTATENTIAAESQSARLGYLKRRFMDDIEDVLRIMAWYLFHDDRVAFPLPPEVAQLEGVVPGIEQGNTSPLLMPPEPWFHGGSNAEGSGYTFADLELQIEPYSMERTSEAAQQQQLQSTLMVITEIAPMIPQMPWVRWQALFDLFGDTTNLPNLSRLFDLNLASQIAGLQLMQSMQPQDPRMAGDVGAGKGKMSMSPGGAGAGQRATGGVGGSAPTRTGTQRIGMGSAGPAKKPSPYKPAKAGAA